MLGGSRKKTTASSTTNPWAPTIPYLNDFLSTLDTAGSGLGRLTAPQTAAFGELSSNAGQAGQFTPDIEALTRDLFGTQSQSGTVTDAYGRLQTQLGDYASGARVDPMSDPAMQALLTSVGDDATDRVNSLFAGAGRDLSAAHVGELGREVTRAQLPILSDAYQRGQDRQIGAATTLYGAGGQTAQAVQGLDNAALATRERGVETAKAALESLNLPANIRLQIEQQMKTLPVEELGLLSQQLFAAAGLGQQSQGTQTQKGTQWGLGPKYPSA